MLTLAAACTLDDPRYRPSVVLLETPPAAVPQESTVRFVWSGFDVDANITHYEYQWNISALVGTADTTVEFTFAPESGTSQSPKVNVFRVRAVDDHNLIGDFVEYSLTVGIPFVLEIVDGPPAFPLYGGESVDFTWHAVTGRGADSYDYAVDDTSSWISTPDTMATLDAAALGNPQEAREFMFYVRGLGVDGVSNVAAQNFLAGPLVPLTIAFETTPLLSPMYNGETAFFSWTHTAGFPYETYDYALDDTASWVVYEDSSLTLTSEMLGNPERPEEFTFYVRALGAGGHSNVLSWDFVAGPLGSSLIAFTTTPPAPPAYAGETVDFTWEVVAGLDVDSYSYAVDDTTTWNTTVAAAVTLTPEALGNPRETAEFTFFVRGTGFGGHSNVLSWSFLSGPKTPPPDTSGS